MVIGKSVELAGRVLEMKKVGLFVTIFFWEKKRGGSIAETPTNGKIIYI